MPRKEYNDYIFYKIVCLDNSVELCYVGSTANWKARNHNHKSRCTNENCKEYNSKKYQIIRANGGWENFKMIEIGTREQLTKRQAEQIEEEYRQELKANLNSQRCYITPEEKQEYQQNYYQQNKDKFLEYREENKDKIKEYQQNYREENRDKISEKGKEKVKCECGCMIIKRELLRHQKTPKHIKLMNQKKTEN